MVLARDYIEQLKIRYNASKGVFLLVQTQFEECQGLATIANECQLRLPTYFDEQIKQDDFVL